MEIEKIVILDFGSQYTHLIANRIRRLGVYSEIRDPEDFGNLNDPLVKGIILSGGPSSVYDSKRPQVKPSLFEMIKKGDLQKPILGICYGHHLLSHELGGKVEKGEIREYGKAKVEIIADIPLTKGLSKIETVWMSHGDEVKVLPEDFKVAGTTNDCKSAILYHTHKNIYSLQFHPEVTHSVNGIKILQNFVDLTATAKNWSMDIYYDILKNEIKEQAKDKKVFLLVSGGVDSTVVFSLLKKTLGDDKVLGVHVDHGLMRLNETEKIEKYMSGNNFHNLVVEDASNLFISALKEKYDPEEKRKIIGKLFLDVKDIVIDKLKISKDEFLLGQGTIYPDAIESGATKNAKVIKTHHNRVDIIEEMIKEGKVIEPLKELYKDEVRELGRLLGLPSLLVDRHPFPGPGLGVRVLCSKGEKETVDLNIQKAIENFTKKSGYESAVLPVKSVGVQGDFRTYAHPLAIYSGEKNWSKLEELSTATTNKFKEINRVVYVLGMQKITSIEVKKTYITKERLDVLRTADDIVTTTIIKAGLYDKIWQMPVIIAPLCFNGSSNETIILRPIDSQEAMTASFFAIEWPIVEQMAKDIIDATGVGAVLYDITHKPPGTIEWE